MTEQHIVYLALGTNIGEREANLKEAVRMLPPQVKVLSVSRLYETAPAYVLDQSAFLNMALKGQTALSPAALLAYLKQGEKELGRQVTRRYGPRVIDMDIIFYDDLIYETPDLQIPHPRMHERAFVLYPLADVAAEVLHPGLKQTVSELLAKLSDNEGILSVKDWQ
jgi:2-amino-4-hydroxy-6-hydroxymethyldihydropteridine diphosphokinase